jgi:hypothetical protein
MLGVCAWDVLFVCFDCLALHIRVGGNLVFKVLSSFLSLRLTEWIERLT